MNAGFREVMKLDKYDCIVFHDVDMIPENDMNLYQCGSQPRHLSPGTLKQIKYEIKGVKIKIQIKYKIGKSFSLRRLFFLLVKCSLVTFTTFLSRGFYPLCCILRDIEIY